MNNLGRRKHPAAGGGEETTSVQALSAADRLRQPGLFGILAALKQYRLACSQGLVKLSPAQAFDKKAVAKAWLYED